MILTKAVVPSGDTSRWAWAFIRRFQNVHFVEEFITELHCLTPKHKQNVRKQATQLRYALTQAKEYFDAAATVTLATKPNLLYYSIMSLAVAEILMKQTGESSLDKARAQHAHHGLVLRVKDTSNNTDLKTSSASLIAKPLVRDGDRFGTFELWHRSCRETPICGARTIRQTSTGSQLASFASLLGPIDVRPPPVSENGLSLFDCFVSSPGMVDFLNDHGITPKVIRGKITSEIIENQSPWRHNFTLIIHPSDKKLFTLFCDNFLVRPNIIGNFVDVRMFDEGMITSFHISEDDDQKTILFKCPEGSMWNEEEVRFWRLY